MYAESMVLLSFFIVCISSEGRTVRLLQIPLLDFP